MSYGRPILSSRGAVTRGSIRSLAACAVLATGIGLVPTPAAARPGPSIDEVQSRVDRLYHQAETASERYNTGRERLSTAQRELRSLRADLVAQQRRVDTMRDELGAMVAAQSQTSPLSTASQLLESDDASTFLSGVAAVQSYNEHEAVRVGSYESEVEELAAQRKRLSSQVTKVAGDVQRLRRIESSLDAKAARAKDLLNGLKEERRERVEARLAAAAHAEAQDAEAAPEFAGADEAAAPESDGSSASVVQQDDAPVSSGSGSAAADFALAQVGDAYVYGAAGPSSWDCSGLTMQAWAAAGVSLPHSAAMQSSMGSAVSVADLQPGDLVFYYSPVSHVGMYVGNGQLVHAPNPSTSVEIVPVDSMPITAVRRVG